jgi:hypothetical protein
MMETDQPQPTITISKESLLFLIPLVGSTLAVTYDVGFFFAIGLDYFSLFSLSEHIVICTWIFPICAAFGLCFRP